MREGDWQPLKDKLWARYSDIVDSHANGYAEVILWHLALRQVPWAMVELARVAVDRGFFVDPFSGRGLSRRAYRLGNVTAPYNLALDLFNQGDLGGYRHWLRRAARAGDNDAAAQLCRFETRLPHADAPRGRRRPYRRNED